MVTEREEVTDISSMPEGIITYILSLTSPPDACRSAAVSRIFCAAVQSDIVWERFLPSDWDVFISRREPCGLNLEPASCSKKEIFFGLCDRPLLIDDGNKSLALERWSGKKCLMLGARDLSIVWGDTPYYWTWESHRDSRFPEVAVLLDVWWLEIRGKMSCSMLSPATTYVAYFVFKMRKRTYYGFNIDPVDATVQIVGGERCTKGVCLDPYLDDPHRRGRHIPWADDDVPQNNMPGLQRPGKRSDGWFEIELGEFQNDGGEDEVEMTLMEVKGHCPKKGLVVHGIEIRPKTSRA